MATTIPAVQGDHVYPITLIDLDLNGNVYYISDAYKSYTVGGNAYTELGAFLNISSVDDNLRTTNGDITLSLAGIPSTSTGAEVNYLNLILTEPVKGGNVVIKRAFMNTATDELDTGNVYTRFAGIITNFTINEQFNFISKQNDYGVSVSIASINTLLETRITGQKTDPTSRKSFFPNDRSFDRIPDLFNTSFDFGKEYTGGGGGYGGGGCFVADTQITMKDGTFKPIQDVKVGDVITSMKNDGSIAPGEVLEITTPVVDTIAVYKIGNIVLECTPDHPVYIDNKGWCSLDPHATKQNHNLDVSVVTVNDCVVLEDIDNSTTNTIQHIEIKQQETQTYNLSSVKDYHTYFANGVLVHNKGGRRNEQQK